MADAIVVMKRYELKYILTKEQADFLVGAIKDHMHIDKYGLTQVASLYYDTCDSRLIRNSLEKPEFKEKIRLRSYGLANTDQEVYLELKRKAYGVVYKRRVSTKINDVNDFFAYKSEINAHAQIAKEITYFRNFYGSLIPKCLIIYDRVAYETEGSSLRLTLDYNPRYRLDNLRLDYSMEGIPLLDDNKAILEIKAQDMIPLWLSHILDQGKIYKQSFSKYGRVFETLMTNREDGGRLYV